MEKAVCPIHEPSSFPGQAREGCGCDFRSGKVSSNQDATTLLRSRISAHVLILVTHSALLAAACSPSTTATGGLGLRGTGDGLFESLESVRGEWQAANPGKPFAGVALLGFDKAAPAVLIKSVFQTAAFAGFPNVSFAVRDSDGAVARLSVDAILPGLLARLAEPGTRLLVEAHGAATTLVWRKGGTVVDGGLVTVRPSRARAEGVAASRKPLGQEGRRLRSGNSLRLRRYGLRARGRHRRRLE
jgi:hypothetical protein